MKTVRLLTAVFLLWTVPALAQTEVNRIYDASEMMDNIEVAKSMEVFGRALSSYSQSYLTNYELGYAYYLQEDYTRAGRIFSRLSRDMSVDDRLYQVWGNSYADRGNDRKAEKIYALLSESLGSPAHGARSPRIQGQTLRRGASCTSSAA